MWHFLSHTNTVIVTEKNYAALQQQQPFLSFFFFSFLNLNLEHALNYCITSIQRPTTKTKTNFQHASFQRWGSENSFQRNIHKTKSKGQFWGRTKKKQSEDRHPIERREEEILIFFQKGVNKNLNTSEGAENFFINSKHSKR